MSALYPNVPIAAGVPLVLRGPLNDLADNSGLLGGAQDQMDSDGADVADDGDAQWGVFNDGGDLVIDPDSFGAIEYMKEYRISNFPVEEGGFQSFNKVETPFSARIAMFKGGSDADRLDFLATVEAAIMTLDLYSIMTPSRGYDNANLTRYDYSQTAQNGVTLLRVDLSFEQVRDTAVATFTNSKAPGGADAVNDGSVQPKAPTPAQTPAVPPK